MTCALAFGLALLFGLAMQRGGTCTVAAVDEWRSTRRLTRLAALVEASLWVCGGLLLARQWGHPMPLPQGYPLSGWTLAGAALLGLGAVLNQACAFGTVARLGSGEWAYAATPLGFYLGCASAGAVFAPPVPTPLPGAPPLAWVPGWVAWLFLAAAVWRVATGLLRRRSAFGAPWSPHAATAVIGISFMGLVLTAGAWAYTDVLAELARRMAQGLPQRLALGAALLAGALAGGRIAGKWQRHRLRFGQLARCTAGGLLMGWGSLLMPGGNDGLVLLAMPMLWPYAWAAFGTMVLAIGIALQALARR